MAAYEFEEEFEDMAEVVEAVAYFVGHPEFLIPPAVGYAA